MPISRCLAIGFYDAALTAERPAEISATANRAIANPLRETMF